MAADSPGATLAILRERSGRIRWWVWVAGHSARATVQAMSDSLELTVRYEDAGDGWVTAQVLEVPGAISEGRGRHEARANVIDALQTVLTPDEQLAGEAPGDRESLMLTVGG